MANYKVSDIVKEYLIEIGDSQLNRFARFNQYAVAGIREWNMDMTGVPFIVELPVSDNDTADLPNNYLNWVKIGICGNDGVIYPLGENKNICLDKHYDACGAEVRGDQNVPFVGGAVAMNPLSYVADHFRNGELLGRFFGIGGGQNTNGYFKIDTRSNQIKLQSLICSIRHIALEYIADIDSVDGDFPVHPFMLETLKAWIYWKSIERDRNYGLGDKQMAKDNYNKAYMKSRKRFSSTSLEEWYRAIRLGNNAAVKF